ncbi:MAG: hypothetical protein JNL45_10835 [Hyphomicrobium sp.]|jgi:hypothetical protein|nr:hypothetical protein [Hyphomicrobium sp.]
MKIHQKGFLLQQLSNSDRIWDVELVKRLLGYYGLTGLYWENNTRVTLDELTAAGLIKSVDRKLVDLGGRTQLIFEYQLTPFGRERMIDTGLLQEVSP